MKTTSWQGVGKWYNKHLQSENTYHERLIIPSAIKLLELSAKSKVLDIGCGNGILAKHIDPNIPYVGVDSAKILIETARKEDKNPKHRYLVADVTRPFPLDITDFTHVTIILAMQNISDSLATLQTIKQYIKSGTRLLIVLNHPCFRIPRQSSWGIDEQSKLQYRRVNRYISSQKIPITMHPGKSTSELTWSFHEPISKYSEDLYKTGFVIEKIEEWTSDKESVGKAAKMENRARNEFPLFMALLCIKK